MQKKSTADSGKRDEIIDAALQLFLKNGYEATSIRMIQKEVGCRGGTFSITILKIKTRLSKKQSISFFQNIAASFLPFQKTIAVTRILH